MLWASPASKADVSRDPCLVPWKPDARCTTSAPPPGCPSGLQPVTHSCFVTACVFSVCTEGKCSTKLGFNNECDTADAGSRPSDCEDLRNHLPECTRGRATVLRAAEPLRVLAHSPDACGCDVPYDGAGVCANAVSSALATYRTPSAHSFLREHLRHAHRCWRHCVRTPRGQPYLPLAVRTLTTPGRHPGGDVGSEIALETLRRGEGCGRAATDGYLHHRTVDSYERRSAAAHSLPLL